jgi:hypothetical protein
MVIQVPDDLSLLSERDLRERAEQCDHARLRMLYALQDRERSTQSAVRRQQLAAAAPWARFVLTVLNKKTQTTLAMLVGLVVLAASAVECAPSISALHALQQELTQQPIPDARPIDADAREQLNTLRQLWGNE